MVGYFYGKGFASYDYLDKNISTKNEDAIRDKIKKDGFDGAVTMRLLDVDKEEVYSRGNISMYPSYYNTFSSYYFRNWGYYANPGYYSTTKTYTVETNVFSIKEDKIIWTGITKTTDPSGVVKMTEEIAKAVFNEMVKQGFIGKQVEGRIQWSMVSVVTRYYSTNYNISNHKLIIKGCLVVTI